MAKKAPTGQKTIALNKQARRLYEFIEKFEAGLALTGSEVKSLRLGRIAFKDGYIRFKDQEAYLVDVHIAPYENSSSHDQHDVERPRKLLLHRRELYTLEQKVTQKGLSIVPVAIYFKFGHIKLEIALARGKKTFDRRDELKQRDIDRDVQRELVRY